jgi:hypothetical protein
MIRRFTTLASVLLAVGALAVLVPTGSAAGGNPNASWRCIAGICVGHSRLSLDYRYGREASDIPSRPLKVSGGHVWACFWRCFGAVTEDGFTHYGGNMRPANRLLSVGTCDPIVRLPDGVTIGTEIPFGSRWRGYRRITRYLEGGAFGWERVAWKGGTPTNVLLTAYKGRVECVTLEQPR